MTTNETKCMIKCKTGQMFGYITVKIDMKVRKIVWFQKISIPPPRKEVH